VDDPAKFSKSLRNIENYIVKTIQQMKKADLAYPVKPKKDDPECLDDSGNPDPDAFEIAVFAWKEDYKSMKYRMERYKRNMKENFVTGTSRYPESPEAVSRINCHKCGKKGHIARECPKKEEEQMHANIEQDVLTEEEDINEGENIFAQHKERGVVNENWVLLDSQSTVDQIANPAFLSNIRKAKKPATVHCNAGSTYSSLKGEFGTLTVKHNPRSIANVLSLHQAKDRHRVTYHSWDCGGVFQVHTQDGIVEFKPCERGLHYLDVSDDESNIGLMLVNTVRGNLEGYTRKEIERAREARRIQGMIANPTEREFSAMVHEKLLANCPVTVQDVNNAHHIYG
jgi:hypothetical protein